MVMTLFVQYWTYSENRKAKQLRLTSDLPLLRGLSRICVFLFLPVLESIALCVVERLDLIIIFISRIKYRIHIIHRKAY